MSNPNTFEVTTPTDRSIVMTRRFDAPRATVFEAWTKAEHVKQWWDPTGVPLSVCEIDLRPNCAFRWINSAHGADHTFAGIYREIKAPDRLVFTVGILPGRPEARATLLFTEARGETTLKMTMDCHSTEDRDTLLKMRVDVGTGRTLENLAAYVHRVVLPGRKAAQR
jgi:uncharacterized protein YndB with AHSA1/START domain